MKVSPIENQKDGMAWVMPIEMRGDLKSSEGRSHDSATGAHFGRR